MRPGRRQKTGDDEAEGHALGRGRGGLICKIYFVCDEKGHPLHTHLCAGQMHEAKVFDDLLDLGITPAIPSKANENRDARPVVLEKDACRHRNPVEGLIDWLKECRRVFNRYEKTLKNFRGMIHIGKYWTLFGMLHFSF